MKKNNQQVVILAGGKGSRLWPLSSKTLPKQFLSVGADTSLLVDTMKRFLPYYSSDSLHIITNETFAPIAHQQIESELYFSAQIIEEPVSKNTAFALLYAASQFPIDKPILFCPSDHHFTHFERLIKPLEQTFDPHSIYLFGVKPTHPETGYGYIQVDQQNVVAFHEKPSQDLAKRYVEEGNTLWNSGIFLTTPLALQEQMMQFAPEYYAQFEAKNYHNLPSISIDHLLLEKSNALNVVSLELGWRDIGCFDALYAHLEKDENENILKGSAYCINSHKNLVISDGMPIGLIDIDDVIVVQSNQGICIAKKGSSQKISQLQNHFTSKEKELV